MESPLPEDDDAKHDGGTAFAVEEAFRALGFPKHDKDGFDISSAFMKSSNGIEDAILIIWHAPMLLRGTLARSQRLWLVQMLTSGQSP